MFRTVIIISLASATLSACAQDSDAPTTDDRWAQLDIPASTQLNELTADQRFELCEAFQYAVPQDFECHVESAAKERSPAACERAKAVCLEEQESVGQVDCAAASVEPLECDADIELYQACLDEQIAALSEAFGALTCQNAEAVDFSQVVEAVQSIQRLTPSCERMASRCPSFAARDDM